MMLLRAHRLAVRRWTSEQGLAADAPPQPVHLHVDAHQQRTDLRAAFADWKAGNATRTWKGYDA